MFMGKCWLLYWKRCVLLAGFLLFGGVAVNAQSHFADSVTAAIDSMPDDSEKVLAALRAFRPLVVSDGKAAMELVSKTLDIAVRIHYPKGEAEAYRMQGVYYMMNGASALALERYQRAYEMFKAMDNKPSILRCNNNFATVYMEMELWDSALIYLNATGDILPTNYQDSILVSTIKHNTGICQDALGNHQAAFDIFSTNLKSFQQLHAEYEESFTQNSIGNVAIALGKPELAITHLRAAEMLKRKIEDQRGLANSLVLLASAYQKLGNIDSAIAIGLRGIDVGMESGAPEPALDGHKNLGCGIC